MSQIRIGIAGYGNLGKSVQAGSAQNEDMRLVAIFTRRDPSSVAKRAEGAPVYPAERAEEFAKEIDVMVLCGGSRSDLPVQGPLFASLFNTVDGFDTHAGIPAYFEEMDHSARQAGKVCVVSAGWDPGMFSINRIYADAILPQGKTYTFWGKGVSQGHSDAIRRVKGVKDGKQYTVPVEKAVEAVLRGETPSLSTREKHRRICYVVAHEGADRDLIEREIKTMPDYFADYDTEVHFITQHELDTGHAGLPHGGVVLHSGRTGFHSEHNHVIEYRLKLDSNPDFTANILLAYARAAYRLHAEGVSGAKTPADIAPAYLSIHTPQEIRRRFL